jgi:hypothetical protein
MTESLPIEEHTTSLEDALESSPTRVDAPQPDALAQAAWRRLHLPHARQVPGGVDVPQLVHVDAVAIPLLLPAAFLLSYADERIQLLVHDSLQHHTNGNSRQFA